MLTMNFNDYIKTCRTTYKMTQEDLVNNLYAFDDLFNGLDIGTLSRWERGSSKPSMERQVLFVKYFKTQSDTIFSCFEDVGASSIEKRLCQTGINNLIGNSKEHIMNFPLASFMVDEISITNIRSAEDIDRVLEMPNTLMKNFTNNSPKFTNQTLKSWALHPSNLFLISEISRQFYGMFFNLRLKPEVFEKVMNFEITILDISEEDFAGFDEMGSNYPLMFFANNEKVASLLFIRYYAHLIANQNNIKEVGSTPLRDSGRKLVEKMKLHHYKDKKDTHNAISAYRSSLEDVLINETVLKMIFQKRDIPVDQN